MRWILLVVGVLAVVLAVAYYQLGGFNKPQLSLGQSPTRYLLAQFYTGSVRSAQLQALFRAADSLAAMTADTSGALFLDDPGGTQTKVRAYVGVVRRDTLGPKPAGWAWREVTGQRVVRARLELDFQLAPVRIYEQIRTYALQEHNLTVGQVALELYPSATELIVEVPAAGQPDGP